METQVASPESRKPIAKTAHTLTQDFGTLPIQKLSAGAILPTRAHPEDAGLDLYALEDAVIAPHEGKILKTGVATAIPEGHVGLIADRSSMGKRGIKTLGGIIDAGYRGEIGVILWNLSPSKIQIKAGERIAQMLILPIRTPGPTEVESLDSTTRGAGGFGSTGR